MNDRNISGRIMCGSTISGSTISGSSTSGSSGFAGLGRFVHPWGKMSTNFGQNVRLPRSEDICPDFFQICIKLGQNVRANFCVYGQKKVSDFCVPNVEMK